MKIALVGNQNCGKTSLFNALTGLNQKVGNWAGVTVERKSGTVKSSLHELIDTPGVYSLNTFTPEEKVTADYIESKKSDMVLNVIDATQIERSLYLTLQLMEKGVRMIIALNMMDAVEKKGIKINCDELSRQLGVPIIPVSAVKKNGLKELVECIDNGGTYIKASHCAENCNYETAAAERYEYIEKIKEKCITIQKKKTVTQRIDKIVLNKWLALPIFALVMFAVYFLSVGIVGSLTVDLTATGVEMFGEWFGGLLSTIGASAWSVSLVVDGIISGVGAVLGFVPQLIILFLLITFLEASGYMSRIAYTFDRVFKKLGLSGKSLIPFIVGSGCSVPGIMATRTIEDSGERTKTAILTPFVPCSAKLPIIVLFSGFFFPGYAGLVSASLYFLAIGVIILSALLMKKIWRTKGSSFISELVDYRLPSFGYVAKEVASKTWAFIKKAGTVILLSSVIIWFLLSFSLKLEYGVNVENSILSYIGRGISWLFYPMLGTFSWEAAVAAIEGIVAKEQVVSAMAIIAGFSEAGEGMFGGAFSFFNGASAYAFMVFNLFSAPCFGAIAAMKKELGSSGKAAAAVAIQTGFAFILSYIVFGIGLLLGGIF